MIWGWLAQATWYCYSKSSKVAAQAKWADSDLYGQWIDLGKDVSNLVCGAQMLFVQSCRQMVLV